MKRKLLLIAMAVVTVFACAFGLIACTDDEPDLSSVNGTYVYCMVELDGEGNIVSAERTYITYILEDGKLTINGNAAINGQTGNYTLKGKDIVAGAFTFEYFDDGIYLWNSDEYSNEYSTYGLIRDDVNPSFEIHD